MIVTESKPTSVVAAAEAAVSGKLVHLVSNGARRAYGTMPLEWPMKDPATGKRAVDHDVKDSNGNTLEQVRYPNLEWSNTGVIAFNPLDRDGAELLKRTIAWLKDSGDKRIELYGISLIEGGNVEEPPFPRYEEMASESVIEALYLFLGEDQETNRLLLERCARYELQMTDENGKSTSRRDVLDALDELGTDTGDEAGDGTVTEA